MLIPIILTFGCIAFLFIGTAVVSWAVADMQFEGPDIKNIIMFLVGIGIAVFGIVSIAKASDYYHEVNIPKTEITTSIPPQIDTIITIKNSVSDTTYIYKFNPEK